MIELDADVVIAGMFARDRQFVGIPELKALHDQVRGCGVYLRIDRNTLSWLVDHRPDMFAWEETDERCGIKRGNGEARQFTKEYVDQVFSWQVPNEQRATFDQILDRACEEGT